MSHTFQNLIILLLKSSLSKAVKFSNNKLSSDTSLFSFIIFLNRLQSSSIPFFKFILFWSNKQTTNSLPAFLIILRHFNLNLLVVEYIVGDFLINKPEGIQLFRPGGIQIFEPGGISTFFSNDNFCFSVMSCC